MDTKTIILTQGAVDHNYLRLANISEFFPEDAVGGHSKDELATRTISIDWGGDYPIETDIAGDKMILRKRGWFGEFISIFQLRAGDKVVLTRHDKYSYSIRPYPHDK